MYINFSDSIIALAFHQPLLVQYSISDIRFVPNFDFLPKST